VINYDEQVIQEHAQALYRAASATVAWTVLRYALLAWCAGVAVTAALEHTHGFSAASANPGLAILMAGLAALIGADVGHRRARRLRLEAQLALCQARIERNTRRP
jgi:hypothetical protein